LNAARNGGGDSSPSLATVSLIIRVQNYVQALAIQSETLTSLLCSSGTASRYPNQMQAYQWDNFRIARSRGASPPPIFRGGHIGRFETESAILRDPPERARVYWIELILIPTKR
jgi:hypothetical protein